MSKKSRRKARRDRERQAEIALTGVVTDIQTAALSIHKVLTLMVRAIPKMLALTADVFNRLALLLEVRCTKFEAAVFTGLETNNSLPLLVYADWCEENNRESTGALARKVADGMPK